MGKVLQDREFKAGSTGWTVQDLDDPEIARLWASNQFEIVEGVLAEMPPAYFDGQASLMNLIMAVQAHMVRRKIRGSWATEVDFIVGETNIARPDAMLLLNNKLREQASLQQLHSPDQMKYGRVRVAPTLVIESVSPGHETHDRILKRRWYSKFGVKNYWILDGFHQTLECLRLDGQAYKLDVMGRRAEKIRPRAFPGLILPLSKLWV